MEELLPLQPKPWTDYVTDEGCRIPTQKAGIRMFRHVPFPKQMSHSDIGKFTILVQQYLVGDSGVLGCASKSGPRPFNTTEIGEIIGLETRRAQQWLNKMCQLHMFHRAKTVDGTYQYCVNPAHSLMSGKRVSVSQFLMFRDDMAKIITPWGIHQLNRFAAKEPMLKCNAVAEAQRIVGVGND